MDGSPFAVPRVMLLVPPTARLQGGEEGARRETHRRALGAAPHMGRRRRCAAVHRLCDRGRLWPRELMTRAPGKVLEALPPVGPRCWLW